MSNEKLKFEDVDVEISKGRWSVSIKITDKERKEQIYIVSADSGDTYGDGIYFGTLGELRKERESKW